MKKSEGGNAKKGTPSVSGAIEKLAKYRAGGDGAKALKTLAKMIDNLVQKPDEPKYRRINLQNEAFKKRVSCFVGGVELLRAVGFVKNDQEKVLVMEGDFDAAALKDAHGKIIDKLRTI